jgi:hypothetical protein
MDEMVLETKETSDYGTDAQPNTDCYDLNAEIYRTRVCNS